LTIEPQKSQLSKEKSGQSNDFEPVFLVLFIEKRLVGSYCIKIGIKFLKAVEKLHFMEITFDLFEKPFIETME